MLSTKIETDMRNILKKKKVYRLEAAEVFPFKLKRKNPVVGIWYNDAKDKNLIGGLADGLKSIDVSVVLFAAGDESNVPFDLREKCATVKMRGNNYHIFYEACDMMISLDRGVDENFLYDLWHSGIVPIVEEGNEAISNYNPNNETGNAFTYTSKNIWEIFAATIRAVETYKFPYDWKYIMRQGLKSL